MTDQSPDRRALYAELRRALLERGEEVDSIEALLHFIYANYNATFWKIILDQMSKAELEAFATTLFEDVMAYFQDNEH